MARGMVPIKGGATSLKPKNVAAHPKFNVGAAPRNVYGPRMKMANTGLNSRNYGKGQRPDFFSTLGAGDTGNSGET